MRNRLYVFHVMNYLLLNIFVPIVWIYRSTDFFLTRVRSCKVVPCVFSGQHCSAFF